MKMFRRGGKDSVDDKKIHYFGVTDVGLKRKINQDSILLHANKDDDFYLFAVADGMGGYDHGEKASKYIVDSLWSWAQKEELNGLDFLGRLNDLKLEIKRIHLGIHLNYNKNGVCGSTCVALMIYKETYAALSIGDSRVYRYKDHTIESLLRDDIWENMSEIAESLSAEEISVHPDKGKLINALGISNEMWINVSTDLLCANEVFLLCSDGLYKYTTDTKIAKIMRKTNSYMLHQTAFHLLKSAYEGGGKDNISIIMVKKGI